MPLLDKDFLIMNVKKRSITNLTTEEDEVKLATGKSLPQTPCPYKLFSINLKSRFFIKSFIASGSCEKTDPPKRVLNFSFGCLRATEIYLTICQRQVNLQ